jgi:hypothetical protein
MLRGVTIGVAVGIGLLLGFAGARYGVSNAPEGAPAGSSVEKGVAATGAAAAAPPSGVIESAADGAGLPVTLREGTADGSVPPGMGSWAATGLCQGMPVTAGNVRLMFDPRVVSTPDGHPAMEVSNDDQRVRLGAYEVVLDFPTQSVTVTGPEGAATLHRDILRCVTDAESGDATSAGTWKWSEASSDWRYLDEPLAPVSPPTSAVSGGA